jgi:hypothetical protein
MHVRAYDVIVRRRSTAATRGRRAAVYSKHYHTQTLLHAQRQLALYIYRSNMQSSENIHILRF